MKQSAKMTNKSANEPSEVKIPDKLPKTLRDEIDDDELSLAIDMGMSTYAVIEITGCVDEETMKVTPAVQRLMDRVPTYTEYVPRSEGIRIIGRSFGQPIELDCLGSGPDLGELTISIYHLCDRWVDISGIPIVDRPFRNIEKLIDELVAAMVEKRIYLK
jgi:hypothetical protein